ncbi:hypothetical protein OIU74_013937 [Salix koriyanagi]|uniref:Uncharacterized protein n=1 Tax=Salix koriyanagi TaxID=2511006 RepID=A0A9Q0SYT0_9ROSI|nr:hypothetical protein OIU74_013937 [Salix koriyanagi]
MSAAEVFSSLAIVQAAHTIYVFSSSDLGSDLLVARFCWWLFGEERDGWGCDQRRERLVGGGRDCHKRAGIAGSGGGYRGRQGKLLWLKRGSCRGRWKWLWAVAACAAGMGDPGCVLPLANRSVGLSSDPAR